MIRAVARALGVLALAGAAWAASDAWVLDLPSCVTVTSTNARLGDLVPGPLPPAAEQLAVAVGGTPGQRRVVSARSILRQLVVARLADGVRLTGADACTVVFAGAELAADSLLAHVTAALSPLVPPADPAAPPARLEVALPVARLAVVGPWQVAVDRTTPLEPGSNLVGVTVSTGERRHQLVARVTLHLYARAAVAARRIPAAQPLAADAVAWGWRDLASLPDGAVIDSTETADVVATAEVRPGEVLRRRHLRPAPLVRAGELVDLEIRRGGVAAVVRGSCRQDGGRDEVVTVRNELTGKLVAGRVAGRGRVVVQN